MKAPYPEEWLLMQLFEVRPISRVLTQQRLDAADGLRRERLQTLRPLQVVAENVLKDFLYCLVTERGNTRHKLIQAHLHINASTHVSNTNRNVAKVKACPHLPYVPPLDRQPTLQLLFLATGRSEIVSGVLSNKLEFSPTCGQMHSSDWLNFNG